MSAPSQDDEGTVLSADNHWFRTCTWLSLLLPLAVAPVWSRLYPVAYFAESAIIQSTAGLFAAWASGSYHMAISNPSDEDEAVSLAALGLLFVAVVGLGVAGALLLLGPSVVAKALGDSHLALGLWMAPVLVVSNGARLVLDQYLIRLGLFRQLGNAMVLTALTTISVPAIGLLRVEGANFLILGTVTGALAGFLLRLRFSGLLIVVRSGKVSGAGLRGVARKYSGFMRDLTPGAAITNIGLQLPQVMLSRSFDQTIVAHYSRAMTLVALPVSVVAQPLTAVYQRDGAAAFRNSGDCQRELRKVTVQLGMVLVPAYVLLMLSADWLLPFAFGPDWNGAGAVARPMIISMAAGAIAAPAGLTLLFAGRTLLNLIWQLLWIGGLVLGFVLGSAAGGANAALWGLAGGSALAYVVYWHLGWKSAKRQLNRETGSDEECVA